MNTEQWWDRCSGVAKSAICGWKSRTARWDSVSLQLETVTSVADLKFTFQLEEGSTCI